MIRPVIGTVAARVVITAANLLVVALAGQTLGTEGLGVISLLVLGITLILVLAHVVGGGGLVYLVPRLGVRSVLLPSYGWALSSAAIAYALAQFVPLAPEGTGIHLVALAFLQALNSIHLNILVGQERIGLQNGILVIQNVVQLLGFGTLLAWNGADLMDYIAATYIAHGLTVLVSGWFTWRTAVHGTFAPTTGNFRALVKQGGYGQLANLAQLLNYRAAYYLIELFRGTAALGVYSVAMQLAEGSWLVPKSIGGVLYSKVSNMEAQRRQVQATLILFKVALVFGACCALALILLPDALFTAIFGNEVRGLRPLLLLVAPGLVAMSGSQVLSHYLSGTGRIRHNLIGSVLGLVITAFAGWALIRAHGSLGAAATATLAYTTSLTYQVIVFLGITKLPLRDLLPRDHDVRKARKLWQRYSSVRAERGSYL
ncbi:MAG TPA: polysaccharide biosynthesis C-terminal domain-containing protein [Flavobacteriales bacterium]|nr:polysaccharide biosynthesis C-terminal domain-containing protein [Flavobacteriales bacterium]